MNGWKNSNIAWARLSLHLEHFNSDGSQIEAWQICHSLLTAPNSPLEGRLFSAQTFRAKVS